MSARTYEFASAEGVLPFLRECVGPKWDFGFTTSLPQALMIIYGLTQVEWQPWCESLPRPPRQFRKKAPR
jgi:hypothetical protein